MLPAKRNKIDISVSIPSSGPSDSSADIRYQAMSEEEQKLFRLYGKLPTHKNTLMKMQKVRAKAEFWDPWLTICLYRQDRKFFDSGDYALSKAGKAPQNTVGTAIPNPEK